MKKAAVALSILIFVLLFTGCNMDKTITNDIGNDEQNINELNDSVNVLEQQVETPKPNVETNSENIMKEYDCSINFDCLKYSQETEFSLSDAEGFDEMIEEVKKIDSSFSVDGYYAYVCINDDCESGSVMFRYFIGNLIETNKAYLFTIENGEITKLLSLERPAPANKSEFEEELIDRVNNFKASYDSQEIDKTNIVDIRERYIYDYDSGELKYVLSVFYQEDEVIIDECTEVIIE